MNKRNRLPIMERKGNRPLHKLIGYPAMTLCLIVASSVVFPLWGQTNRYSGGKNDGYTKGCVPPVIRSVIPMKNGGCVEEGDLFLSVDATGTDITYQWQKQDENTKIFKPYQPQGESQVEGIHEPTLRFIQTTELDNGHYRCVLTNACSDEVVSDTFFVSVSSRPVIKSGLFDREVCVGEKVMYNVVAEALGEQEYTYRWYKNGYRIDGVEYSFYTFNAAASKITTDVYVVDVSNKCGSVKDTSVLTITPLPLIESYQDEVWVCRDSSVTLSVKLKEGGDYTYELVKVNYPLMTETPVWQGVENSCTLNHVTASAVYRWKVTNQCGTVSSDLVNVKVEDVPVISLQPQSDTVCEGTTVLLTCSAVPAVGQALTYTWYKDGISVERSPQSVLRLRNVTLTDAGAYRCEINNSCPAVRTEVAYLGVLKKPSFLIQPELVGYYCEGDSIRLAIELNPDVPVDSIQWFYGNLALQDNEHVEGSATKILKVRNLTASDAVNTFYAVAYNNCGEVKSRAVQVDLHYPARFVRNASDEVDLILCGGSKQTLFVSATGSDTIRYTWTYNGRVVADGYSNRLVVDGGDLDASGEYVCQVQNACGNDKVVSYVRQSLPPLSEFTGGGHYCPNEAGVSACLLDPQKNTDYQLFRKNISGEGTPVGGRIAGDTATADICFDDLRKGVYYVVAYDTNSCDRIMNGEALVEEDSLPIDYALKVVREICEGEVDGDLALVKSQPGIVYSLCKYNGISWDTLAAPYHGTGQELLMSHLGAGRYKVVAYNPLTGCKTVFSSEATLTERPLPEVYTLFFKDRDSVYCANEVSNVVLQYSQYTSGYSYQLKKDGADYASPLTGGYLTWTGLPSGMYTLEVSNSWGCKAAVGDHKVTAQDPPAIHPLTGNRYFCSSLNVNRVELTGSINGIHYQLRTLSGRISVDTVGTGSAMSFVVSKETDRYYVIATDNTAERCHASSDTIITEKSNITATSRTISADYGTTVKLSVPVSGYIGTAGSLVFEWDNPDKLLGSDMEREPETTVITESRLYTVVVTDSVGCSDTATVLVRCYGGVLKGEIRQNDCMVDAGDTVQVCLGEKLSLCGMVSGGFENRGFSYKWWTLAGGTLGTDTRLNNYEPIQDGYIFWKVSNGPDEVVDSVWITVNSLNYPTDLPVLNKEGLACGDSTVVLSIGENRAEMIYTLKKDGEEYTCLTEKNDSITWTLSPVEAGVYTLEISDGICKVVLPDSVKVFHTPAYKGLKGDSVYCQGAAAKLYVDTIESGISYQLFDKSTNHYVATGVQRGTKVWFENVAAGDYYVEAVAGECITTGGSHSVNVKPLPDMSLNTGFDGGTIACSGVDNYIKIEATEAGKMYILRRRGRTDGVDTLFGDGNDCRFKPLTAAGTYVIYAEDTLSGCNVLLSDLLKVEPGPSTPTVTGCSYCDFPGATGCQVTVNYKLKGVYYQLIDSAGLLSDQLNYADGKQFSDVKAGTYQVVAEDSVNGCKSPAATVNVIAVSSPMVLPTTGGCFETNAGGSIATTINGEGNTVLYILYKNGNPMGTRQPGTGNVVTFGNLNNEGIYKIWAQNSLGCGTFMEDSVVVYPPLQKAGDTLHIEGVYCSNQPDTIKVSYPLSTRYWKYYLTNGTENSDTLYGNGGKLEFTLINRHLITPGTYELKAMTPCEEDEESIALGVVENHALPDVYSVGVDSVILCAGERLQLKLAGSGTGVNYTVDYHDLAGAYIRTYPAVSGTGDSLVCGEFSAAGIYKVYADNGCRQIMDSLLISSGTEPAIQELEGDEVCLLVASVQEIELSVSERENNVNYYLYLDGTTVVDSLTPTYRPDTTHFEKQGQVGCYQIIAEHRESGCRQPMNGIRCMGQISQTFGLLPDVDTVKICNRGNYCISLDGSEKGVQYILYRDNDSIQALGGTGDTLNYECVTRTGNYKVKGKVAVCTQWMDDVIRVEVQERLPLSLNDTFYYCEGDGGVHIRLTTSDPAWEYTLVMPDGRTEVRNGAANHMDMEFNDVSHLRGFYYVEVFDPVAGCLTKDSTIVLEEPLPRAFDLFSSQGHYICVDGSVTLTLAGSESDVKYELHRTDQPAALTTKYGTGSALQFPKLKTSGTYYIKATRLTGLNCENNFGSWDLYLADSLVVNSLVSIKNSYCYSDIAKGTIGLDGSRIGLEYELLQDGNSTGLTLMGTGGPLVWTEVEGKACVGTPGETNKGYKYSIQGRDTLTGCLVSMIGLDTVIEAGNIAVWTYQPNEDLEKCEGERVDFNVLTSGCGQRYTWYHEDTVVYYGKNNYNNIDSVSPEQAGRYYCYVENACGNAQSPVIHLTVRKKIELVRPMEEIWACTEGGNVMISSGFVNANGYYWYKEGAPDRCLSTRDYLFLTNFQEAMAGKYICRAGGSALDCNVVYDTCKVVYGVFPVVTGIAKVDTVCEGSVWQTAVVNVDPSASVIWKHNEDTLNFTGSCYTVASVSVGAAGNYIVEATNKCGTKAHLIGKLYVDQPLRVDTVTPALQVACIGMSKDLYIKVSPSNGQEKYEWLVDGQVVGHGSTYRIPAYTESGTYEYQVWYTNKCTSGPSYKEISLHIPGKLEFLQPDRTIAICSGEMSVAPLTVTIDPSLMANFRWYFQKSEDVTERVDLNWTANSYTVPLTTQNTGYYYCDVYNECESKTTQTTWVRVDTVPTLQSVLADDTICANTNYTLKVAAQGGNLDYSWQIQKRGELIPSETVIHLKNELVLRDVSVDYDSCVIWCKVHNDCGALETNKMVLRVGASKASLSVTPSSLLGCDTSGRKVRVELLGGHAPWIYKYQTPSNIEQQVVVTNRFVDTLRVDENGIYQFTWLRDGVGCVVTDSLPTVDVNVNGRTQVTISGGGDKCQGDTASIHIHIEQGHGPWEITLAQQSGGYATDIADAYPLRITGRDTVLTFYVEKSDEYYIYQSVKDLGSSCSALVNTDRIQVVMHPVGHIEFKTGWPAHIGSCVTGLNLLTTLDPSLDGLPFTSGDFYVDSVLLNGDHWLLNDVSSGCHMIQYQYTDTVGCKISSDEIRICIDSAPSAHVTSSPIACGSVASYFTCELSPAGGIDSVVVRMSRYKKWDLLGNPDVRPRYSTVVFKGSDLTDGFLRLPLTWDNVGSPDSCIVFELLDIIDHSGCHMEFGSSEEYLQNYCDTVWRHSDPEVEIQVRRSGDPEWRSGIHDVSLREGDSVAVKVSLVKGMPYWSLPDFGLTGISGLDTVIWLKSAGDYVFRAYDDYCGRWSSLPPGLKVTFRETGYFSGRLLLEGPFDADNGVMHSSIADKLGLPLESSLSDLPSGVAVIDWLHIELRVGPNADTVALLGSSAEVVAVDSCLLLSDGRLADRFSGSLKVGIRLGCDGGSNNRYIVVRHRNHLGVMSRTPVHFVRNSDVAAVSSVDFTQGFNIYSRDGVLHQHMSYLSGVGYLLSGGELNTNFLISLFDPNNITRRDIDASASNVGMYDVNHDINFDGRVDWPGWNVNSGDADWNIVRRNRQKFTEIR